MALTALELANAETDVQTLGSVVNGASTDPDVINRDGLPIKTLARVITEIESSAADIIGSSGYEPPVNYAAGLNMLRASQTVFEGGDTYAPIPTAVPFVTGAIFDPTQWRLVVSKVFVSRAELKAAPATDGQLLYLVDGDKSGSFRFSSTDHTALCTADPLEGIFIAPASDPTGASGAWLRNGWAALDIRYFGAKCDDGIAGHVPTNDGSKVEAAWALSYAAKRVSSFAGIDYGSGAGWPVYVPGGTYVGSTTLTVNHSFKFHGDSVGLPAAAVSYLRWDAGVTGIDVDNTGFHIDGVFLIAAFTGIEGEHHAIHATRTFSYRNIGGGDWGGDFLNLDCDTGGNVNGVVGENAWVYNCRDAYNNLAGSDNNAGSHKNWNVDSCRRWGMDEKTFLGNKHDGHEVAGCSLTSYNDGVNIGCSVTSFSGNRYFAIAGQEVWCSTHAPSGTTDDNPGWAFGGAGGAVPTSGIIAWFSGILVRAGGSYYCNGINGGSTWIECYSEGAQGSAQICTPSIVIGSTITLWKGNPGFRQAAHPLSDRAYLRNDNGFLTNAYTGTDEALSVALAEPGNLKTVWQVTASVNYPGTLRCIIDPNGGGDIGHAYGGASLYTVETGPNTAWQFGTGAPVPFANFFSKLMIGSDVGAARKVSNAAAAPAPTAIGEIYFNQAPNASGAGSHAGWKSTAIGTAVPFGGRAAHVADISAAPTQADFNNLLAVLQTAGLMA